MFGLAAGDKIGVLKSLGVYGANASGKSNVLLAFDTLSDIVRESGDLKEGDPIPWYTPFRLTNETRTAPTRFEIEFVTPDGQRFLYKIEFNKLRIIEEQLTFYQSRQPAVLFSRHESDTWETIKFGTLFKGGRKRFPLFANNAYLSKAGNSADAPDSVRKAYNYLRTDIFLLQNQGTGFVVGWIDRPFLKPLSKLICLADTAIEEVTLHERDTESLEIPNKWPEEIKAAFLRDMSFKPLFSHQSEGGDIEQFEIKEESAGTRRLFQLGPLLFDALTTGGVLLFDELESSMHPFMAEMIIKLFNDPEVNPRGAQLIFSTHNVTLMSNELLRRDQIWFAEKENGASTYFSLADFDKNIVKPKSPFNRWYLEGRFDAIPRIDYRAIVSILKSLRDSNAKEEG